ncbi:MAG: TetR/AcrR family transcriptional regulator [Peptostreptococcaceae bacterium]|nr:TetR/AcrR family transcriptional regulator [Peptostreptococcaceae bacterium]
MDTHVKNGTKQNLIDVFWMLYEKKDISKITVKEITAIAGYNRSTFYEYYSDVYDVLDQLEESLMKRPMPELEKDCEGLDFESKMRIISKVFEKNKKYLSILLGDNGDPAFQRKMKNKVKPMLRQTLIEQGLKDESKIDIILEYQISAMLGIMVYMTTSKEHPDLKEVFEITYRMSECGMSKTVEMLIEEEEE